MSKPAKSPLPITLTFSDITLLLEAEKTRWAIDLAIDISNQFELGLTDKEIGRLGWKILKHSQKATL